MKKKILYINKQYRSYDYLKYVTIAEDFELTVLWICPFRDSEPLPSRIGKNIDYQVLGLVGYTLKPWHLMYNLKLLRLILKYGRNADLILSSTSDAWWSKIVFLVGFLLCKPIAFRKEAWFDSQSDNSLKKVLKNLYRITTKYIEARADAILYPGVKQKEYLLQRGIPENRLFLFPYLIDDLTETPTTLVSDKLFFTFLYVGRIIPLKGLDSLIEAFSLLEKEYDNVRLIVIGGPSRQKFHKENSVAYYKYCKKLANRICRNIEFIGQVNPDMVYNYYRIADVFVQPNKKHIDGQLTGEGWGNVIVEAASMGIPLIATDRVASAFELIRHGESGFIVNSENLIERLFEAMKFFVQNHSVVDRFGKKSRETYERYNDPSTFILSLHSVLKSE